MCASVLAEKIILTGILMTSVRLHPSGLYVTTTCMNPFSLVITEQIESFQFILPLLFNKKEKRKKEIEKHYQTLVLRNIFLTRWTETYIEQLTLFHKQ